MKYHTAIIWILVLSIATVLQVSLVRSEPMFEVGPANASAREVFHALGSIDRVKVFEYTCLVQSGTRLWEVPIFNCGRPRMPIIDTEDELHWDGCARRIVAVVGTKATLIDRAKGYWSVNETCNLELKPYKVYLEGDRAIVHDEYGFARLFPFERMEVDDMSETFTMFRGNKHYLPVGNSLYDMTRGEVDVYERHESEFELVQTLRGKGAGCYGHDVHMTSDDTLIVAEPFCKNMMSGAGKIHVYRWNGVEFKSKQSISCPDTFSHTQQYVLEFGKHLSVSPNGKYMAVSCGFGGQGSVYVYRHFSRPDRFIRVYALSDPDGGQSELGRVTGISDVGNLLFSSGDRLFMRGYDGRETL